MSNIGFLSRKGQFSTGLFRDSSSGEGLTLTPFSDKEVVAVVVLVIHLLLIQSPLEPGSATAGLVSLPCWQPSHRILVWVPESVTKLPCVDYYQPPPPTPQSPTDATPQEKTKKNPLISFSYVYPDLEGGGGSHEISKRLCLVWCWFLPFV